MKMYRANRKVPETKECQGMKIMPKEAVKQHVSNNQNRAYRESRPIGTIQKVAKLKKKIVCPVSYGAKKPEKVDTDKYGAKIEKKMQEL